MWEPPPLPSDRNELGGSIPPPLPQPNAAQSVAPPRPPVGEVAPVGPPAHAQSVISPPLPPNSGDPIRATLPRWPWWSPLAAAGITLGVLGVVIAIATFVVLAFGGKPADYETEITLTTLFGQNAALIGAAALIAAVTAGRPTPNQFGIRTTPFWRAVGLTVLALAVFFIFSGLWATLLHLKSEHDLPSRLGADDSTLALIATAVLVTVGAPLGEELFFRGLMFTSLYRLMGMWPGAIVTGLAFGAVHIGGPPIGFIVPLAVLGFLLCVLYRRSGSLIPCMVLHAINNSIALGVSESWSWQIPIVMVGSVGVVLAVTLPLARSRRLNRPPQPKPTAVVGIATL